MAKKLNLTVLVVFGVWFLVLGVPGNAATAGSGNDPVKELREIKKNFGPVLNLKGPARKEVNAIANLISPGSKLVPIDATKASGEMCMLETVTKHNMIHYSEKPEQTQEDVVYYINPATFVDVGLDINKLPRHPKELGKMVPFQWYYYDGTYVEPHQGNKLNKEFLIMAINVK